jgi:ribosome-binding protein aMBF1 (putative translation factor)
MPFSIAEFDDAVKSGRMLRDTNSQLKKNLERYQTQLNQGFPLDYMESQIRGAATSARSTLDHLQDNEARIRSAVQSVGMSEQDFLDRFSAINQSLQHIESATKAELPTAVDNAITELLNENPL